MLILFLETSCNAAGWYAIDNHKYLINYWTLAVAISVANTDLASESLRLNGRFLIGLCFAFAVFWKLYGGQFVDGSFLEWTLLTDRRVAVPVSLLTGIELVDLSENRAFVKLLADSPSASALAKLQTNVTVSTVSLIGSYWTILIESACAVLWLTPVGGKFPAMRDASIFVFVTTTYFLLPVVGFASVMSILGLAACRYSERRRVLAYLSLLLTVQLASIPWQHFAATFTLDS